MSSNKKSKNSNDDGNLFKMIIEAITKLLSSIPTSSHEKEDEPELIAKQLTLQASLQAAAISGVSALPPGPVGLMTIIPELIKIWEIQKQLIADIAAIFGKTVKLNQSTILFCLFRHGSAQFFRDLIVRVGERFIIKRTSLRFMQTLLQKIGLRLTQRLLGKGVSRWIPIVGAIGMAAFAFIDTTLVGKNAAELFSKDIDVEG